MKVVIFCGGLGVRMGEETQTDPEADDHGRRPADPLAHHEVVRLVGHTRLRPLPRLQGRVIKEYFLNYNEALSNDFVLSNGGTRRRAARAATSRTGGSRSSTPGCSRRSAERLSPVAPHLEDDEYFLATYGDGLTDAPLPRHDRAASIVRARPGSSSPCGRCSTRTSSTRTRTASSARSRTCSTRTCWINGGFFVLRRDILDWIKPGEELVDGAVQAADRAGELLAYRYDGFWEPMDTIKDKQRLDALAESGKPPWRERRTRRGRRAADARLSLARRRAAVRRVLALGCHADDIEIGCGGDDARADPRAPGRRGHVGRARRRRASAPTRRGRAPRRSSRRARAESSCHGFRDGLLPVRRWRGQGRVRGSEARVEPDLVLTHTRHDLHQDHRLVVRAHLEHVARPPHPRVRDPEVRRRPRRAERLRPADEEVVARKARPARPPLSEQRGKHWFDEELFLRPDAASRAGVRVDDTRLRRGVLRAEGRPLAVNGDDAVPMRVLVTGKPRLHRLGARAPSSAGAGHDVVGLDTFFYRAATSVASSHDRRGPHGDVRDVTAERLAGLRRGRPPRGALERPARRSRTEAGRTTSTSTARVALARAAQGGRSRAVRVRVLLLDVRRLRRRRPARRERAAASADAVRRVEGARGGGARASSATTTSRRSPCGTRRRTACRRACASTSC